MAWQLHGPSVAEHLRAQPIDYATLAEYLAALGYPLRLELLDVLRFPHTLSEIKLSPARGPGGTHARIAARQTIQGHLDKLVETDLVRAEPRKGEARPMPEYIVNSLKLYELTEEMRRLTVRYAGRGPLGDATGTIAGPSAAEEVAGPRLVLVHGVYEGKAFPLDKASQERGGWILGRRKGAAACLDYDPFVSLEHSVLHREGGRYVLTDLGSKNGTAVNWTLLPRGGSRPLKAGDVVGVGRSLLSFLPE